MEDDKSRINDSISTPNPNKRDAHFDSSPDSISKKSKSDKITNTNEKNNDKLLFVIEADGAEDKGSRHTMEDKFVVFPDATLNFPPGTLRCAHYAIYDGHGGQLAAEYAQRHLHSNIMSAGLPLGCESCEKSHIGWVSKNRRISSAGECCRGMDGWCYSRLCVGIRSNCVCC